MKVKKMNKYITLNNTAKLCYLLPLVLVLSLFNSCKKEGTEQNLSAISTLPVNSNFAFILSYNLDENKEFLYVNYTDFFRYGGLIQKIRLTDLVEVNRTYTEGLPFVGARNMIFSSDNHLITNTYDPYGEKSRLIMKFNTDLDLVKQDTIMHKLEFSGVRILNTGNNELSVVGYGQTDKEESLSRFMKLDNNLNVISSIDDTASVYGTGISGRDFIKCENGGFLYVLTNQVPPFDKNEIIFEKRDANFNLEWRSFYKTPSSDIASEVIEANGKFYVYCGGTDTTGEFESSHFVLVYDQQGYLLANKEIRSGALDDWYGEPILATEDGGFLIAASTSLGTNQYIRKGIVYKTDGDLNVTNTLVYGGDNAVTNSGIVKVDKNRYLLLYLDNSFNPSGNAYRLVLRYLDENGNYIE